MRVRAQRGREKDIQTERGKDENETVRNRERDVGGVGNERCAYCKRHAIELAKTMRKHRSIAKDMVERTLA